MIAPTENLLISYVTGGEGWHNYHHAFPWDYKASEMGHPMIDLSTYFIHTFSRIGWAYDMKQASPELIKSIVMKKGDGTHNEFVTASKKKVEVK
jgi:stearoyl-CoA desaturase (delta-9 desaturase)